MPGDTSARELSSLAGFRVVALFAHPDDESYGAAATLHLCARLGAHVVVVSATDGEAAGHFGGGSRRQTPTDLAAVRRAELADACRVLGLHEPRLLGLPDGGLAALEPDDLCRTIAAAIADERPDLVITHGSDGAYGHRDHLAVAAAAKRLPAFLGGSCPQRILTTEFPRDLFAPVRRALRRHDEIIDRDWRQRPLGVSASAVAWRIALDNRLRQLKLRAIGCHASQLPDGDPHRFLHPRVVEGVLAAECFGLAAGTAPPGDAAHPCAGLEPRS